MKTFLSDNLSKEDNIMSRIGRLPVAIPAGVEVSVAAGNVVTVKGPKGTLERALPTEMEIKVEDGHPWQGSRDTCHCCAEYGW